MHGPKLWALAHSFEKLSQAAAICDSAIWNLELSPMQQIAAPPRVNAMQREVI